MAETKLTVIEGYLKGKVFSLERGASIGRFPGNDIALEDSTASRNHARIRIEGGGFILTDLGSQNGTFVNLSQVKEVELKNGDEIKIGNSTFRFEREPTEKEGATVVGGKEEESGEGEGEEEKRLKKRAKKNSQLQASKNSAEIF